jgi:6-phosphofructokinase
LESGGDTSGIADAISADFRECDEAVDARIGGVRAGI